MNTLEFEAYSKNKIIDLPQDCEDFDNSRLKVILIKEDTSSGEHGLNNQTKDDVKEFLRLQKLIKEKDVKVDKNLDIDKLADEINQDDLFIH